MTFTLNEAVIRALTIFNNMQPVTIDNDQHCSYSAKVIILQDSTDTIYTNVIKRLYIVLEGLSQPQPDHLEWQLRQLYRILNAAAYSIHPSMQKYKNSLMDLLKQVESTPSIQSWLIELAARKTPRELLCTGHGEIYLSDSVIKKFHHCQLLTYAPVGSMLDYKTAAAGENGIFNKALVYVNDLEHRKSFLPKTYDFPQMTDQRSVHKTPEMRLTSDNLFRARVLEKETGRVLWESEKGMLLSKIMEHFPGSVIHWLVCSTVYPSEERPVALTPNANYLINYTNKENLSLFPNEEYLRKLRQPTTKLKLEQSFTLFSQKRTTELHPEVKRELKRKKIPDPKYV